MGKILTRGVSTTIAAATGPQPEKEHTGRSAQAARKHEHQQQAQQSIRLPDPRLIRSRLVDSSNTDSIQPATAIPLLLSLLILSPTAWATVNQSIYTLVHGSSQHIFTGSKRERKKKKKKRHREQQQRKQNNRKQNIRKLCRNIIQPRNVSPA